MATENICAKVLVLLELPDEGIERPVEKGQPPSKGDIEIIFDIIHDGIAGTNWVSSEKCDDSGFGMAYITLIYED